MNRLLALLLALTVVGCAHSKKKDAMESLKPAVEDFHKRVRWKDYRSAAGLIIPERRDDFLRARRERKDDQDLSITDYEIEQLTLSADGQRAVVISRMQWMRLPSVSAHTATVTSEFVYQDGVWLLERQLEGPFEGELP